jgi:hypothetical protein
MSNVTSHVTKRTQLELDLKLEKISVVTPLITQVMISDDSKVCLDV